MEKIGKIILNDWYFRLTLLVTILFTTNHFSMSIYSVMIYPVILWGCIIAVFFITFKMDNIKSSKINLLLFIFLLLNVVTVFLNYENQLLKNGFVMLSTMIYFMIFVINSNLSNDRIKKEIRIISYIVISWSFVQGMIQLILFLAHKQIIINNGENAVSMGYSIRGEKVFQLSGISDNLTTVGMLSFLSILMSLYIIFATQKKKIFIRIFVFVNLIVQVLCLAWSNNLAGIFSLTIGFIVISFIFLYKRKMAECKIFIVRLVASVVVALLIGVVSLAFMMTLSNTSSMVYRNWEMGLENVTSINSKVESDNDKEKEVSKDTLQKENIIGEEEMQRDVDEAFRTGSGRYQIWLGAIDLWKEKPLFGHGYKNTKIKISDGRVYGHMHNMFFQVLVANGGIATLIIFIFFACKIIDILKLIFKGKEYNRELWLVISIVIACIAFNMVNSTIIFERTIMAVIFWIFLGYSEKCLNFSSAGVKTYEE